MKDEGGRASRTTETAAGSSSATDVSLREFFAQHADWQWRFLEERDRRYAEVQDERDKAEVLRAANQAYKDEQANALREQLAQQRAEYASKDDLAAALATINATLKPIIQYVASQQGARQGGLDQRALLGWAVAIVSTIIGIWFAFN